MVQLSYNSQAQKNGGASWENADQSLLLLVDMEQLLVRAIAGFTTMEECEWSTLSFGKIIMGLSPKDITFTTKTGKNSTTESKIFNWLMSLLTSEFTEGVNFETANGGSRAENAGKCNLSLSFTSGKTAFLPGVGVVASGTPIRISASEKNASEGHPGSLCNFHSTVKSLSLMQYLVRLTKTPTGGIVLDPFTGSGSTGCAAVLEERDFIGIESNAEYCEIAKLRIEYHRQRVQPPLFRLPDSAADEPQQGELF